MRRHRQTFERPLQGKIPCEGYNQPRLTSLPAWSVLEIRMLLRRHCLWHYENRAAPRAMGAAARERAEANFTVAHYRDRPLRGEVKAQQEKQNGMQSHGPRLTTLQFQIPTWEVLISTTSQPRCSSCSRRHAKNRERRRLKQTIDKSLKLMRRRHPLQADVCSTSAN